MATVTHAQAASLAVHTPLVADRWIRCTTTASVLLLAGIAAVVSYGHMHALAAQHGEGAWASALIPLSCDGMIIASSMALLSESRAGGRGGFLPWALLLIGALASLAANIAVAEPTVIGRVIAAWPSFALTCSYELLMRQIRQSSATLGAAWRRAASRGIRPAAGGGACVTRLSAPATSRVTWCRACRWLPPGRWSGGRRPGSAAAGLAVGAGPSPARWLPAYRDRGGAGVRAQRAMGTAGHQHRPRRPAWRWSVRVLQGRAQVVLNSPRSLKQMPLVRRAELLLDIPGRSRC